MKIFFMSPDLGVEVGTRGAGQSNPSVAANVAAVVGAQSRLFDLSLAFRDRRLVNVVQHWCGEVAVHLRTVMDVHGFDVRLAISVERQRMFADARENLRHLQSRDF